MKLNEAKFIAEIKRLAEDIRDNSNIDQAKTKADGIISICNILDVDLPIIQVLPADYEAKLPHLDYNLEPEIFNQAKEEQHGGAGK